MKNLDELREDLFALENFIDENRCIPKRLPIHNLLELKEYYKKNREIIISELERDTNKKIKKVISQRKYNVEPTSVLLFGSDLRMQNCLVDMFNESLSKSEFMDSTLKDGIFLPAHSFRNSYNPPHNFYLNFSPEIENVGPSGIKFIFNKSGLISNDKIDDTSKGELKNYILQKDNLSSLDYQIIKEYFLATAPFVIETIISKFKKAYIEAKEENTPVIISTPFVNTTDDERIVLVLETLYYELFKQGFFKDTIFEFSTTAITHGNAKYLNPILLNPFEESIITKEKQQFIGSYTIADPDVIKYYRKADAKSTSRLKQHSLRLILNTHDIENISHNHIHKK